LDETYRIDALLVVAGTAVQSKTAAFDNFPLPADVSFQRVWIAEN
jgi:hypothetical protein